MENRITLYSAPNCIFCKKTKTFFIKNNIKFTNIDISKNKKALNTLVKKTGKQSVPVIEINNKIINGFNIKTLKSILNLK